MKHEYDPRCVMCNPSAAPGLRTPEDEAAAPWRVLAVLGKQAAMYAYTYGLWESYRHPELLIRARPAGAPKGWRFSSQDMGSILNECGRQIRDGDPFDPTHTVELPVDGGAALVTLTIATKTTTPHYLTSPDAPVWLLRPSYRA